MMTFQEADDIALAICEPGPRSWQLPGWCTTAKARRLIRIAATSGEARCVELGVHGGRSLVALGLGLQISSCGKIDGIDAYRAQEALEGDLPDEAIRRTWETMDYEATYKAASDALVRHGLQDVARIIRTSCDNAAKDYAAESIGLIHVDSNHTELASCRDVDTWLPKMARRAIWIADDTNWPSMQKALGKLQQAGFRLVEQGSEGYWSVYVR